MVITKEVFNYHLSNTSYEVVLIRKRMKNIHYRFIDGKFLITAPRLASKKVILQGLDKFAPKLVKYDTKTQAISNDEIYIFGECYPIKKIIIDNVIIDSSDADKLKTILSALLLDYVTERVRYFANEMGVIDNYKVKIRDTKTRLGSNSKRTKTIAFAYNLIHFSKEIIDSVVIHELAHCKIFDHSKDFYNVVYQHCPNYNVLRKKLIHSVFK